MENDFEVYGASDADTPTRVVYVPSDPSNDPSHDMRTYCRWFVPPSAPSFPAGRRDYVLTVFDETGRSVVSIYEFWAIDQEDAEAYAAELTAEDVGGWTLKRAVYID